MKKIILILGFGEIIIQIVEGLRNGGLCKELIFVPGDGQTIHLGENLNIPGFGQDDALDCKEIGNTCLDQLVDIVLVGPEHETDKGLDNYFQSNNQLQKIKVIGPYKPIPSFDTPSWYKQKYFQEVDGAI